MSRVKTQSSRGSWRVGGWIFSLLLMAAGVGIATNQQLIADQLAVWRYQPTAEVNSYVERTAMTDTGKFYLYASHPHVETTRKFNDLCGRTEAATAILGCYVSGRIYVYGVSDARLDGIRDVTAAHEMLHAVYVRLSPSERAKVDSLIEAQYKTVVATPELSERMAFYERTEPGERNNELHSIFATEFAELSPELEAHYGKYFQDRQRVVALHARYADVFAQLKSEAETLLATLKTLQSQIAQASDQYNADVTALNRQIEVFNRRAAAGDFSSQAQFSRERSVLLSQANMLDRQRSAIDADVARHEQLRTQYNETVTQSQDLYESIDSNLAPAPTV